MKLKSLIARILVVFTMLTASLDVAGQANAGLDQTGCTDFYTLSGSNPLPGTGLWTVISGSININNPSLYNTSIVAGPGESILRWTVDIGGNISFDDVQITNNLTYPNASIDVSVCENNVQLSGNSLKPGESGLWTIDGGVMSEVFSSTSVNNPIVTNLRQGYITFAWTISNGMCNAADRMFVINNNPTVDAGQDRTICENFITLAGNNPDPGSTGLWTCVKPGVIIANPGFYNTNITNLAVGENLFTWTITNNDCVKSDDVIITRETINVAAGAPHTEACSDTLNLDATVPPSNCHSYWTAVEGSATFDNPTSYATVARNLNGFNKLRWTIVYSNCQFFDEIEFVNLIPPQALTQADKSVCSNSTQITANPAIGVGEFGLWTRVVGSSGVVIGNPNSFQTVVSNLDQGENVFKWTISNSSCSTSHLITITNNQVFANAGQDKTICSDNYSLSANLITGSGSWTSTSPGVIISNNTSANTSVSNLAFGNNSFQWAVSNYACNAVDEVIITSNLPRNVWAGTDQNICSGSTYLFGSNPGIGKGQWTITGGSGTIANSDMNITMVNGLAIGENIFNWTVTVGACSASNNVMINNNVFPVNAGTNQTICNVNSLQLNGMIPGAGITGTWSVNGGTGIFDNASVYNTIVRNPFKGVNTYRWTLTDGICSYFDDVDVVNNTPDLAVVGQDQIICNDNTIVNAIASDNGTGSWSVSSGSGTIINPLSNNTNVTGINKGLNTFTWTVNKNGCKLSDDINVTNNSVDALISDDQLVICTPNHTATIIGNAISAGESGTWIKLSSGAGTISNSLNNVTTLTGLGNGDTFFRWTVSKGLCNKSDDIRITDNYFNSTASASGPSTLCVNYSPIVGSSLPFGATGLWSSNSSNITFDNNSLGATTARNLPAGSSSITWAVTKNGCSSPSSFSLINNAVYSNAGAGQIVCQPTASLAASGLLVGQTGYWTVNNTSVKILNSTYPSTAVSNLISGDNIFTWIISGNGCSDDDQMVLSNNSFTVSAGTNKTTCDIFTTLNGTLLTQSASGLWSGGGVNTIFVNQSAANTDVNNLQQGINTFIWTVNDKGCTSTSSVSITSNYFNAIAGNDQFLTTDNTTLTAQLPDASAKGEWTLISGVGTFANSTLGNTAVSNLAHETNVLRWTVNWNNCNVYDDVIISFKYTIAEAGPDQNICNLSVVLNAANLMPANATGTWTITSGSGIFTDIHNPKTSVTGILAGSNNIYKWTVSLNGFSEFDEVNIINNQLVANAGADEQITDVSEYILSGNLPDNSYGIWTSSSSTVVFNNPSINNASVSNIPSGKTTFTWTLTNECGSSSDDVFITKVLTSIEGLNANGIKIYPNPSDGKFNIEFENMEGFNDIEVYSINGKKLLQKKITKNKDLIDLGNSSNGLYFIQIRKIDKIIKSKIVIQN